MAVTRQHVGTLGFRNIVFTYTHRPRDTDGELPPYLRYSSIPTSWEDRYREMDYQNYCPVYRASLRGGTLPLVWQHVWDRVQTDATQRRMLDEAASHGLASGISIPIRETNGDRVAIGISTDLGDAEARKLIEAHLPLLFLMSHHLHTIMVERYVDQTDCEATGELTARELDCLYWVAVGKSTWEISEIHGISENTVKFHLGNIRDKLDVTTRAAAVAKAFRLGLLEL